MDTCLSTSYLKQPKSTTTTMARPTGLQYIMNGTWTHNIYIQKQTSKLEGVVGVVVSMSAT